MLSIVHDTPALAPLQRPDTSEDAFWPRISAIASESFPKLDHNELLASIEYVIGRSLECLQRVNFLNYGFGNCVDYPKSVLTPSNPEVLDPNVMSRGLLPALIYNLRISVERL